MQLRPAAGTLEIERGVVSEELRDDALRVLHMDLLERGASARELSDWLWGMHWFPHLRHEPEILRLADALPERWREGTFCEPQILLQFPHAGPEPEITFHVDQEPPWAEGRAYLRIVGVPLTPWRAETGGLLVKTPDGPAPIELDPGDAVMMTPDVPHSGGINRTGEIRFGVYFRWLEPVAADSSASRS
jgi:ectoine hydroxylase-related dioxygenase (phytanoyl-CoA dioxygenase family)